MADFPSAGWFEQLRDKVNLLGEFKAAARWFRGSVGWQVDDALHVLDIDSGEVRSVKARPETPDFSMVGDEAAWRELLEKGTINRLFRQGRIDITGDRVAAMRFWKVLWHLTETARTL